MNQSDIVKDLLHKLSKNEFLAQDGGNQGYYNKAKNYRNQLNGLYGAGREEDEMTAQIVKDFVQKAEQQMVTLLFAKTQLETEIARLKADGTQGDAAKNATIDQLRVKLQEVEASIAALTGKLSEAEQELIVKDAEINKLKENIKNISVRVNQVKGATVNSSPNPVQQLFARLNGFPTGASTVSSAVSSPLSTPSGNP